MDKQNNCYKNYNLTKGPSSIKQDHCNGCDFSGRGKSPPAATYRQCRKCQCKFSRTDGADCSTHRRNRSAGCARYNNVRCCYQRRYCIACRDCRRCGGKVYQAEMQLACGGAYHKICFTCLCCRKFLDTFNFEEHCGEIFCKQCYIRNFGPQGYGYGINPGALQTPL